MTIKTILTEPDKLLRQISKRVEKVGEEERRLMMLHLLKQLKQPKHQKKKNLNKFYHF